MDGQDDNTGEAEWRVKVGDESKNVKGNAAKTKTGVKSAVSELEIAIVQISCARL